MLQNSYDLIASEWHANFRGQAYVDHVLAYVDEILKGVPPGAKVLDLGCGTGNPIAKHIVERGFRVVGYDQSNELLAIAKTVVPEGEFIHADMVDVEFEGTFAAAVAWDSIFHVERKHHAAIYTKIAASLDDGGRLLLSVGASDAASAEDPNAEGFTSQMFGQAFFYSGYATDVSRALLETAGFEIELWELDDPASHGHIAVIGRKTAAS
ncbi:MAG TPA: class I SAM-dependent methyltransferase [Pyrinomonadaceae bacterium]|jgi:cyclopropane fatty-acyl-phospholipid synthase-like methyltransferase|nr:class I SAM-dependent methyltransferase [Pyrinomonadaceae bacterium]